MLQSCNKDSQCFYIGDEDDVNIEYRFITLNSSGEHLVEFEVVYDKISPQDIIYKWELNGHTSTEKTMTILTTGSREELNGFIRVNSASDDCFLYKDVSIDMDLSGCCDYLGDQEFMDIVETKYSSCSFSSKWINLKADFKGPANMELLYTWTIDGQVSEGKQLRVEGQGIKRGQLKVMNPIDSCYMLKDVEVDMGFGGGYIGNTVWLDNSGTNFSNHIFDAKDETLEGVQVDLYSHPSRELLNTIKTDRFGRYLFEDVSAGNYIIRVHKPEGLIFVRADHGNDDSSDSDVDYQGYSEPFFLEDCEINLSIDAGLKKH